MAVGIKVLKRSKYKHKGARAVQSSNLQIAQAMAAKWFVQMLPRNQT